MIAPSRLAVEDHIALVSSYVLKYCGCSGVAVEDTWEFSSGCLGLVYAWENFDANRGIKFSTYATTCIANAIRNEWRKEQQFSRVQPIDPLTLEGVSREEMEEEEEINLQKLLNRLTYREREILKDYYGIGRKQQNYRELGKKWGVSGARIQQVALRAKNKLKALIRNHNGHKRTNCSNHST
jgi:RNA polymerase sigma factor (sigma-70 family)